MGAPAPSSGQPLPSHCKLVRSARVATLALQCCIGEDASTKERTMERHLYLYAYDLPDDRRRAKLLEMCQRFATGGQRSAYECWWSPAEAEAIRSFTQSQIDPDEDRILILRLDPRVKVHTLGKAVPPSDPDVFMFG